MNCLGQCFSIMGLLTFWTGEFFVVQGSSVDHSIFSSNFSLYPPDAICCPTPLVTTKNVSRHSCLMQASRMLFEQRPESSEGVNCAESLEKSLPGRGSSRYKGSEVGAVQCVQRTSKVRVAGVELYASHFASQPYDQALALDGILPLIRCMFNI